MTASETKPRVAWVALQPAPYLLPLFEALHDSNDLDIHFFFSTLKAEQPWLIDRYKKLIEPASQGWSLSIGAYGFNPRVVAALVKQRWDAVFIAGYATPTMQAAIFSCLLRRIPFILQADTTLLKHRHWLKRALKRVLVFPLLRRCNAAIGNGIEVMRYWHYVGIPQDRTFIVPYTSHLDYFRKESVKHAARRSEVRRQLEIAEESVLGIFVGRLITEKALDVLLQGLAMLDPQQRPQLLFVGEGPEREKLQRIVRENLLPVKFLGFRQNHELPALYAASDFFVLSSCREAWGVVVAEAMASGLPVVLSDRVGATSDLLEDGRNGFLVTGGTASDWCNALKRCMNARGKWQAMSERSRSLISGWNCEKSVNQCMAALKVALAGKSGRGAGSRETY